MGAVKILAIDPGPKVSGVVLFEDWKIVWANIQATSDVIRSLEGGRFGVSWDYVACEMIASYGMAVGAEVFETCLQIGRICHAVEQKGRGVELVFRKDVKMHLCGTPRAKDANIRQALIDRLGPAGTKKDPGGTYGVKSHAWAALAVAVTVSDKIKKAEEF